MLCSIRVGFDHKLTFYYPVITWTKLHLVIGFLTVAIFLHVYLCISIFAVEGSLEDALSDAGFCGAVANGCVVISLTSS